MMEIDDNAQAELACMALAKRAGDALEKQYPGHVWMTECAGGVLKIRNTLLSGRMGMVLRLDQLIGPTFDRMVMLAGGELLERYDVRRGRGGVEDAMVIAGGGGRVVV